MPLYSKGTAISRDPQTARRALPLAARVVVGLARDVMIAGIDGAAGKNTRRAGD